MAELTIRPEEIRDALARFVQEYEPEGAAREEIGTVIECGDGIARVEGLPSIMASELVEFENGVRGLALNLEAREIGVVILGEFNGIEEGQQVKRDRRDPLGAGRRRFPRPRGRPARRAAGRQGTDRDHRAARCWRSRRPRWSNRQPVKEPMQTGIKAIDAMTAIGRGQRAAHHRRPADREDRDRASTRSSTSAPTGSRATPSSRSAASTSRSARRAPPIARCVGALREAGAMEYTTIVAAPASDPLRLQVHRAVHRLAPSASTGCTRASTR